MDLKSAVIYLWHVFFGWTQYIAQFPAKSHNSMLHRVSLVVVIVMMSSGSTSMANAGTKGRINFLFLGALSRVKLYCFWNV